MDIEDILDLLGEDAKKTAFSQNLERVRSSPRINLDALRICIKILPKTYQSRALVPDEQLWDILQTRILAEDDPGHLLEVAKICLSNPLAATELHARLWDLLNRFLDALSFKKDVPEELHSEAELTAGVLRFLKCTYWLPPHYHHLIERDSIALISKFMGIEELDHLALDTLSALLSLLKRGGRIVLAPPKGSSSETTTSCILQDSIVDESIFERITQLPKDYTLSMSSKIFGVWFQWISQAVMDEVGIDCIYHETYWEKVRTGLLIGYGDQRKYCLGIIEQSLQLARKDIDTPTMKFRHETQYLFAYKKYASLFEMIVLNRYAGQVEASLPELTALLGSDSRITPSLATTLIAAAINSKVQEGIRKLVGNWYMKYVIEVCHTLFLYNSYTIRSIFPLVCFEYLKVTGGRLMTHKSLGGLFGYDLTIDGAHPVKEALGFANRLSCFASSRTGRWLLSTRYTKPIFGTPHGYLKTADNFLDRSRSYWSYGILSRSLSGLGDRWKPFYVHPRHLPGRNKLYSW